MEDWEMELEFETYQEYEKELKRASGENVHEEVFEVDDQSFSEDLKEFMGDEIDPNEWEEVTNE